MINFILANNLRRSDIILRPDICEPQAVNSRNSGLDPRLYCDEQGPEKTELQFRRPDYLLCIYAGGRHGK